MLALHKAALTLLLTVPLIGMVVAHSEHPPSFDPAHYPPGSVITRDVVIIGGGSSGVYTAIRAKDSKKSVLVIEKKGRLGGHTETYTDPATGLKTNYGVVVWHDLDIVKKYFARFNIPLEKFTFGRGNTRSIDFSTGKELSGFSSASSDGLAAYAAQLAKYPYLDAGFFLPDPVPKDLLLPFADFVKKYPAIKPAVYSIFLFNQGLGDLLRLPTLYLFKNFGLDVIKDSQTGFLIPKNGDNSELYRKAGAELGQDVLLNSSVVATQRKPGKAHAKLVVKTPSGLKLIRAKKLVITIPPLPRNLRGFDLGHQERSLFKRFSNEGYWTGLLRNTGISGNESLQNVAPDTPYNIPSFPGIYSLSPSRIPGLVDVKYGADGDLPDAEVKANIIADLKRLQQAGSLNSSAKPEFVVYSSHTPFELNVPAKDIADGFYRKLYALQGKRHTYYTGAAFHAHDSSLLWNFTEAYVIPRITC